MNALNKIDMAILLDNYGVLLTDRQRRILEGYCNYDCSLAELSEEYGITRQGVRDTLVKGGDIMQQYESKLGLVKKARQLSTIVGDLRVAVSHNDLTSARQLIALLDVEEDTNGII